MRPPRVASEEEVVREVGVVLPPLSAVPVPVVSGLGDGDFEHKENDPPTPRRTRQLAEEEPPGAPAFESLAGS